MQLCPTSRRRGSKRSARSEPPSSRRLKLRRPQTCADPTFPAPNKSSGVCCRRYKALRFAKLSARYTGILIDEAAHFLHWRLRNPCAEFVTEKSKRTRHRLASPDKTEGRRRVARGTHAPGAGRLIDI